MALTTIDNGSIAKSSVLNDNFVFLDEKISKTAQTLDAKISMVTNTSSSVSSNLATTQTTVSNIQDELSTLTTTTEGKASKDLSDVEITTTFAEKLASALAPNCNASFTISNGWTATKSGWICMVGYSDAGGNVPTAYIDGKEVYRNHQNAGDGRAGSLWTSSMAFIGKGQVFTTSGRGTTNTFYPCKGVKNA